MNQDPKVRLARALLGMSGYVNAMTAGMLQNEMRGITFPESPPPHEVALELLSSVFEGLVAERGWREVMRAARVVEDAWERAQEEILMIDPELLAQWQEEDAADAAADADSDV